MSTFTPISIKQIIYTYKHCNLTSKKNGVIDAKNYETYFSYWHILSFDL